MSGPSQLDIKDLAAVVEQKSTVVLLDSGQAPTPGACSYLFFDPQDILCARTWDEIPDLLCALDRLAPQKWLAGYLCYEAAFCFEERFFRFMCPKAALPPLPLAWFGVFDAPMVFSHVTGLWNRTMPGASAAPRPKADLRPSAVRTASTLGRAAFGHKIAG
jgi:hypothetical protein